MKTNYCVVNFNIIYNEWNIFLESNEERLFYEYKSKKECVDTAKNISKDKNVTLYIYDKNNNLTQKIDNKNNM